MKTNPFPLQLRLLQKSKSIKPIHERHFINVSPEELHAAHPKEIDPQDGLRIRPPALSDVDLHERIGSLVRNGTIVPWQIPIEAHQQQSELQKVDSRFIPWENTAAAAQLHALHGTKPGQSAVLTDSAGRMFINVRIPGWKGGPTSITQPFYLSSGGGGKGKVEDIHTSDYVRPGDWIPYFGHQEESHDSYFDTGGTGWLIKHDGIGDRYHSQIFQHIGNYLNHVFGDMSSHAQAIKNNSMSQDNSAESIPMYGSGWTMVKDTPVSLGRFIGQHHLMHAINSAEFSPQDRAQMQKMGRDLSESYRKLRKAEVEARGSGAGYGVAQDKIPLLGLLYSRSQQRYNQWVQSRIAKKIGLIDHIIMHPELRRRFGLSGNGNMPTLSLNGAYLDHPDFQKPLEARESTIEWPNGQRR